MVHVRKADARIRHPQSEKDWQAIRELCCRTGDNGQPIARERWPFFADLWVGPYQKLEPSWTYVADIGGVIAGYLTGAPATRAFERRKRIHVVAPMLMKAVLGRYERNADIRRFLRRTFHLERGPERRFPKPLHFKLAREFPAHLHINVEAACRGLGLGRLLVDRFLCDLRACGIPGAHVFCGADPVFFYKSVGFFELDTIDLQSKRGVSAAATRVYAMGCKLTS